MSLIIDLKAGEKVIINGAVIENAGQATKLRVHNQSNILKQKEIMADSSVTTPASRVYFYLQCAYIFPHERERYTELFLDYLKQYIAAAPSASDVADEILSEYGAGNHYKALKSARKLLKHEGTLLELVRQMGEDGDGA